MGIFEKYLKTGMTTFNLSTNLDLSRKESGVTITNISSRGVRTVDFKMIDFIYLKDGVSFNIINKMVQTIMKADYKMITDKKGIGTYFENFFDEIGRIGEETTLKKLFEFIFKDLFMYGNSFVELIYNKRGNKIVDLKLINTEMVDYARTKEGNIAIDENSKPIGYMISIPYGMSARGKGDIIPEKYKRFISKNNQQIFLLPKRIAHFKINAFGDRYWGVGLLEPILQQVLRKKSIEEAQTNSIYTRGTYPVIAEVGDINHEPSESELKAVLETLQNMRHDRYFSFPYFVKIKPLEVGSTDAASESMLYLTQDQAAAAGIPMPFATSAGEATNRATLNNQQQIFELVLEYYADEVTDSFQRFILRRIKEVNNLKTTPKVVWGDIKAEEKNDKAKRLNLAITDGIIAPAEAREYTLNAEDLEPNEKEYKDWMKNRFLDAKAPIGKATTGVPEFEEDVEKKEITTKKQ